ncbi:WD40 repeat domain-containing protein [Nocardia sp. NPDC056541]|uniref:WD40 repeat domain-containing protein n=1 Tax=unclassified Nocardia TaxID=2637762 RepID=UPI003670D6A0
MIRIDVLHRPEDADRIQPLLAAFDAEGVRTGAPQAEPPSDATLVVVFSEAMADEVERTGMDLLTEVTSRYRTVVPMAYVPDVPDPFDKLNPCYLPRVTVSDAAKRVTAIARYGGADIVEWARLVDQASKWRTAESTALLNESALSATHGLLRSVPARSSPHVETVRAFVAASSSAVARRRRRTGAVLAVTIVALAALVTFATVQTVGARRAQSAADRAADAATADRLSRVAVELIGSDPDLPSILVTRAEQHAATDAVRGAAAAVAAQTWPHTAVRLDYLPREVSAAQTSTRIAITAYDQTVIRVYDAPGGNEIGVFDYHEGSGEPGGGFGELSPDGELLVTTERLPGPIKVFDVAAREQLTQSTSWRTDYDRLLGWWDNDEVLLARNSSLLRIDARTGASVDAFAAPPGTVIKAADRSRNGRHLAVATEESVFLVDAQTGAVTGTVDARGISKLQVNDNGTRALGIADDGNLWDLELDDGSGNAGATDFDAFASSILDVDGQYQLVGDPGGSLSLVAAEYTTKAIQRVRAHTAGRVQLAALSTGQVATVAVDQYLRIWDTPASARLGVPTGMGIVSSSARMTSHLVETSPLGSARNQIRHAAAGLYPTTILPGYARLIDRETMADVGTKPYFGGLDTDVFLSDNGRYIATVGTKRTRVCAFAEQPRSLSEECKQAKGGPVPMAIGAGKRGIGDLSDDGSIVGVADSLTVGSVEISSATNRTHRFDVERAPVAVFAAAGEASVVTADGYLRTLTGAEYELAGPVDLGAAAMTIAAAEVIDLGHMYFVTVGGDIVALRSGRTRIVGNIGAEAAPFALRVSPSGERIAVMTERGIVVVDTQRGTELLREPSLGSVMVTDAAFTDDARGLMLVTGIGTVRKLELGGSVTGHRAPREATAAEVSVFDLGGEPHHG